MKVLEVSSLSKSIKGKEIIKEISFEVNEGQVFGFLGPNGAGKTMTLRMIVGLIKPTRGDVFICGHSIKKDFVKAMANVGCIIENPELYSYLSGYDNLKVLSDMEGGQTREEILRFAQMVGLENRINDKVNTYSLGMKQRLGIAQALMKSPKLLILDEPTNGLDPAGIKEFRKLIRDLASGGMTVFVSSHLLAEIQMICDEVAIILRGEIIQVSKVEDLQKEENIIWQLRDQSIGINVLTALGLNPIVDGDSILVSAKGVDIEKVNRALMDSKCGLMYVCKRQKTLEELFMELTGGETIG